MLVPIHFTLRRASAANHYGRAPAQRAGLTRFEQDDEPAYPAEQRGC